MDSKKLSDSENKYIKQEKKTCFLHQPAQGSLNMRVIQTRTVFWGNDWSPAYGKVLLLLSVLLLCIQIPFDCVSGEAGATLGVEEGAGRTNTSMFQLGAETLHRYLSSFPLAAVTNCHKLGGVKQQTLLPQFSHSSHGSGWPRNLKSRCHRATLPLKDPEKNASLTLPSFWWLPVSLGVPWFVAVSRQSLPPSSHDLIPCVYL